MLHKIKNKIQFKTVISAIPAVLFLVFLYYMMIMSYTGTVQSTIESTASSFEGFTTLSDSLEEVLQKNFYDKNSYINLNGLAANLLGINSLNDRQKLANSHLAGFQNASDTTAFSNSVIALDEFLEDRSIDFIYLLAPNKVAFYDAEFAPGYSSNAWKSYDSMLEALDEAGVTTIDMDAWFEENGWDMDDVYFKTDHHWKPEAALEAAKCTMELISEQGLADYNEEWLDEDNWTVTVLEDWFLGSNGKRTGTAYAGVDDISVYEPDFSVGYSYSGLHSGATTWEYYDNILDLSYMEEIDYYNDNPYCIYMYADYCIRRTINGEGWNDKRVLIVGDSFKMPVEYFLTTQFKEIYTLDLRYYRDGTLAEYIEEIQPDIVIMCTNDTADDSLYAFGVEEYLEALAATSEEDAADVIDLGDASIEAQENNGSSFTVLYADLEPNQAYTLTLDSTSYSGGRDQYIQMTLQNLATNEAVYNRYFDANSEETQKWIFTTPEDTSGIYAIYLYAGTKGNTKGVSVDVTGIQLQKGMIE